MTINITLTDCVNITTVIWSEGQHNVTIWLNDSVNNVNFSSVTFNVDSIAPVIVLQNYSQYSIIPFSETMIITDDNLDTVLLNDTSIFNITNGGLITNITTLAIGFYTLNVSANDSSGNLASGIFTIKITLRQKRYYSWLFENFLGMQLSEDGNLNVATNMTIGGLKVMTNGEDTIFRG